MGPTSYSFQSSISCNEKISDLLVSVNGKPGRVDIKLINCVLNPNTESTGKMFPYQKQKKLKASIATTTWI